MKSKIGVTSANSVIAWPRDLCLPLICAGSAVLVTIRTTGTVISKLHGGQRDQFPKMVPIGLYRRAAIV
jgi:pyocin large subunit-like protein